jgi:hypothetical protein
MMGVRYYQSPDGSGSIKHHPFCVSTLNTEGEKEYALDEQGNRIRSVRINKDGTPYIPATAERQYHRITREEFIDRRRRMPTKKQAAAIEDELKAQKDLITAQVSSIGESVEHVHDENCDHPEEE